MTIIEIILLCYNIFLNILIFWILGNLRKSTQVNKEMILYNKYICGKCNSDKFEKATGYKYQGMDADFLTVAAKIVDENDELKKEIEILRSKLNQK